MSNEATSLGGEVPARQRGHTTLQIQESPRGAVFVWCNSNIGYANSLARAIGRNDLRIEPSSVLLDGALRLRGLAPGMVIIDHALRATAENIDGLRMVEMSNASR